MTVSLSRLYMGASNRVCSLEQGSNGRTGITEGFTKFSKS